MENKCYSPVLEVKILDVPGTNSGDCGVTFLGIIGDPMLIFENDDVKLFVTTGVLVLCRFYNSTLVQIHTYLGYNITYHVCC